jgi:hypothetical protein
VLLDGKRLKTRVGAELGWCAVASLDDEHNLSTIQQLHDQSCLRLQMYCRPKASFVGRKKAQKIVYADCELSVIVYGQATQSESVGNFLQACGVYLQDPEHCDCDVPYLNPQCLSQPDSGIVMTSSLQPLASTSESIHDPSDIFGGLSSVLELGETETPANMKTRLKR